MDTGKDQQIVWQTTAPAVICDTSCPKISTAQDRYLDGIFGNISDYSYSRIFWNRIQFFKLFHQNINVHENFLSFLQYLYLFKYLSSEHLYINVQEKSLFCSALHFESTLFRRSHVSFSKWSWPLRVSNQMPIDPSSTPQTCKRRKNHHEYTLSLGKISTKKTEKMSLKCHFLF